MNYTEKEIEVIKKRAYDRGRIEGILITLLICVFGLIILLLFNYSIAKI